MQPEDELPEISDIEISEPEDSEAEEQDQKEKVAGPSLRKAINDMCKCCTYDPYARGTWRYQVDMCPTKSCPLHLVRPRSKYQNVERVE